MAEYQLINISVCIWVGKFYNILDKIDKTEKLLESKKFNLTDSENNFLGLMQKNGQTMLASNLS